MKLSRESQYALLAATALARAGEGARMQAHEIATALETSPTFTAKVLQKLARAGILASRRGGRTRGYELAAPAAEVSSRSVVEAIDPNLFAHCVFWSDRCSDSSPCLLHPVWRRIPPRVAEIMGEVTISDLIDAGGADALSERVAQALASA